MYTYDFRVGFSQSDLKHQMTIPAIIDAFQDVSCFQSEDLGVGFKYLEPKELVWVINYWEVEFLGMPKYGDKVTSGTFPYEFKSFMGFRNFFLQDDKGNFLAKANSIWVLMDWVNMCPARPDDTIKEAYVIEPRLEMNYGSRKIALPKENVQISEAEVLVIQKHHLDFNGHVNNGQYVKIAMSYIPSELDYKKLRVEYRNQAHLGDEMYPVIYKTDSAYTVSLNDSEGKAFSVIELTY